jgi:hypothetical protein
MSKVCGLKHVVYYKIRGIFNYIDLSAIFYSHLYCCYYVIMKRKSAMSGRQE